MEQIDRRTNGFNLSASSLDLANRAGSTFRDGESWAPLITQNVQADAAVGVDVGVVDACGEVDLGRLEGVVGREVDCEEEDTTGVGRLAGAHDSCLPVELVGSSVAIRSKHRRTNIVIVRIPECIDNAYHIVGFNIPDLRRQDQQSMTTAGHCSD